MAEHLGFYAISTKRQYVPAALAGTAELAEVVDELGYQLEPLPDVPPPALVRHFTTTLQSVAARTADRWRASAEHLADLFTSLRNDRVRHDERTGLLHRLRETAADVHGDPHHSW
jgi:hypothetical protein